MRERLIGAVTATDEVGAIRPRRLRRLAGLRRLVRETRLSVDQLLYPMFVVPGEGVETEIGSLPGQMQRSVDRMGAAAREVAAAGIQGVLLFGQAAVKSPEGDEASSADGAVQRAIGEIKETSPELVVFTDVCLCAYTDHGHCGVLDGQSIDNDASVERIAEVAISHAQAGADVVAPSDMMDGRVGAIRSMLDAEGFSETAIMAYAAKYASAFYGPFREASGSAPAFGDRRGYQMDPGNAREALWEVGLDLEEGADIVMVKPALTYLDVVARVRAEYDAPLAAYLVSGEYAAIKAGAARGWLDERAAALEALTAVARAGADIIITYWAPEAAGWLDEGPTH
ncbi:MAG: porphobilinogen synthase [Chloroflexota bacterium]|nr:porphobilinogen synthase [Chloroflexota bacterium]MDE2919203.1 porphobilinogen synthase [Chloroflexota bacterium]